MNDKDKKMIAPIVITVLIVLYYIVYFGFIVAVLPVFWLKIIVGVIPAALAGAMIYVCIQRINEIRSGEEDDLSKY